MTSKTRKLFAYTLLFYILLTLLAGCKNHDQHNQTNTSQYPKPGAATIPRNTGIRPAEAYSNLFLDSSALESFLSHQLLNDTLTRDFRNFYNHRNFQFAWLAGDGLTEQALAFSSLYNYSRDSSTHRKWLDRQLDSLQKLDTLIPSATNPSIIRTELQMTWRFINYLNDRYAGEHERADALLNFIPIRKRDPLEMARSILASTQGKDKTMNPWYDDLKGHLQHYVDLATDTSYHPPQKTSRPGTTIKPHPLATIKKILVNLERMRWMPPGGDPGKDKLILVNIPEFELHVLEDQRKVFDMKIVVGKEGHGTVLFSGTLDRISFNPYWNVPRSIVVKEIMPEMEKNNDYLEEHDMEITGEEDGIPKIRQLPGEKNELGKMKFLFPNSFNIYLHDSPHKHLFSLKERAYSHGCIRVAEPEKLALYLLQPTPEWDHQKIDSLLATGNEHTVRLRDPVPVLICYFTCWSSGQPEPEFRKDIYGHDERLAKKLFMD